MDNQDKINFIEVSVKGKSDAIWLPLKAKLLESVNSILDTVIDSKENTTIKEEVKELTSCLLKYAKAKLNNPAIENQKLLAEIETLYTKKNKEIAETRKINAEATAIEFQNKINSLSLSLQLAKVLMISSEDEGAILYVKEIDGLIDVVKSIKGITN